jgi:hypothetical protein
LEDNQNSNTGGLVPRVVFRYGGTRIVIHLLLHVVWPRTATAEETKKTPAVSATSGAMF